METYEVRTVLKISRLGDIPAKYPEATHFRETGYSAESPFVLISWEYPRDARGRKLPAPKNSWEPLENLEGDLLEEWQAKWQEMNPIPVPRRAPDAPKKAKAPKRKLPELPQQPEFTEEEPTPKRKRFSANENTNANANANAEKPIAVRTSQTSKGKVTIKMLRIQPHPVMSDVPSILLEEQYEDGRCQRVLVAAHVFLHDWTRPIAEKLVNQVNFGSN
jgi:hypothetical protein